MVFISHPSDQGDSSHEFFTNSVIAYLGLLTLITGNAGCVRFMAAADSASVRAGDRLLPIQPYGAVILVLLFAFTCTATAHAEQRYHEVRGGDTLSKIAKVYGVTYSHLACLNDITDPNRIAIGQRIAVPRIDRETQILGLMWPLKRGWMSSIFGPRRGSCHHGIDIAAPRGTVVRASEDGRVVFSGRQNGYGKVVIVRHSKGYRTLYAHLQKSYVKVKQAVRCGQRIAEVGSSGRSTGPHLHFEVRKNGRALDPMSFLPQKTQIVLNPESFYGTARGGN